LDLRLLMGRQWLKMLAKHVGGFADGYRGRYRITAPDPTDRNSAAILAHPEAWQRIQAVATRAMDGYAFYEHVTTGGDATDGVGVPPGQRDAVRELATRFVAWLDELFLRPGELDDDAWLPPRFEYGFRASAPTGAVRRVRRGVPHRPLDWYRVDVEARGEPTTRRAIWQDHTCCRS
jgi:hypothetical protein